MGALNRNSDNCFSAVDLDAVINELKDHIGKDWKKVARELKFTQTDIDVIEYRERNDLREQIHLFFSGWKMREGTGATVQKLIDALKAARLQGILDSLSNALPGKFERLIKYIK